MPPPPSGDWRGKAADVEGERTGDEMECVCGNIISCRDRTGGDRNVRCCRERRRDRDVLQRRETFSAKEINSFVRVELPAGIELIDDPGSGAIEGDDHHFRYRVRARAQCGENQKSDRSVFLHDFGSEVARF